MNQRQTVNGGTGLGRIMLIGMWIAVLGLLTLFFDGWLEQQHNPNQHVQGVVTAEGTREVVLDRNRTGHYVARGTINGTPVDFMLDTGASDISIPATVADRLKLERGRPVTYHTANGTIVGYLTQLDSVTLGTVARHELRASINPYMEGEEILLGMSFLGDLEFSQRDGRLTIRQRQ